MSNDVDIFHKEKDFDKLHLQFQPRADANAMAIKAYVKHKMLAGTHKRRLVEYYRKLGLMDRLLGGKPFKDLDEDDLQELVAIMLSREGHKGRKLGNRTINNYKLELRSILKFLGKKEVAALIKDSRITHLNDITPEDLLEEQELHALLRAATSTRDRAIIALGGEAGPRTTEYFNLQVKDVVLNSSTKAIYLYGKGQKRYRPIIGCVPHLADWLNVHPKSNDPEAPLFITNSGKPYTYGAIRMMLRRTFARAGVKKPAVPEIFRHTVNTFMYATQSIEVAAAWCGHVPGSRAYRHYIHLSKQLKDAKYRGMYGLEVEKPLLPPLMPKVCKVCELENAAEMETCQRCKNPLSIKVIAELTNRDRILERAMEDPAVAAAFEARLFEVVDERVEKILAENRTNRGFGAAEI